MVAYLVDSLTSLIEPIIMPFLEVTISGLIIEVYLPIFYMSDTVSGKQATELGQGIS
jgi:type II secretory pathway component PulF